MLIVEKENSGRPRATPRLDAGPRTTPETFVRRWVLRKMGKLWSEVGGCVVVFFSFLFVFFPVFFQCPAEAFEGRRNIQTNDWWAFAGAMRRLGWTCSSNWAFLGRRGDV